MDLWTFKCEIFFNSVMCVLLKIIILRVATYASNIKP